MEQNFQKAAQFIRSAAAQGVELVVLPEYHLSSWRPKEPGFLELGEQAETYVKKYQELAKECNICVVPGTILESHRDAEREEDRLLNVAYFIDNKGEVIGKYIKKNLWYARPNRCLIRAERKFTSMIKGPREGTPRLLRPGSA